MTEKANLGLASTRELLAELQARAEVGGYAEYRTVEYEVVDVNDAGIDMVKVVKVIDGVRDSEAR